MKRIPNFFVVGAPKCGTTSLYYYFSQHPEIYLSPIKEPLFFAKDIVERHNKCSPKDPYFDSENYFKRSSFYFVHIAYLTQLEHYLELFRNVKEEKAIGEMAVLNLFSKVAANEIFTFNPNAKIIIILRNPVNRTFSHFNAELRDGRVLNDKFIKGVMEDYERGEGGCKKHFIEQSLYYEQIKRYLNIFPKNNVKVVLYEDYKKDIRRFCSDLFEFIGVSPDVEINFVSRKNQSFTPKFHKVNSLAKRFRRRFKTFFPKGISPFLKGIYNFLIMEKNKPLLSGEERAYLLSFFKEDILKTQELINRDLSQWLKIE